MHLRTQLIAWWQILRTLGVLKWIRWSLTINIPSSTGREISGCSTNEFILTPSVGATTLCHLEFILGAGEAKTKAYASVEKEIVFRWSRETSRGYCFKDPGGMSILSGLSAKDKDLVGDKPLPLEMRWSGMQTLKKADWETQGDTRGSQECPHLVWKLQTKQQLFPLRFFHAFQSCYESVNCLQDNQAWNRVPEMGRNSG